MSLKVFAVCIPEMRCSRARYDPPEPPECGIPCGIFVAETHGQAKWLALGAWAYRSADIGVYIDDFPNIRARIISYDPGWEDGEFYHELPVGEFTATSGPLHDLYWSLWPREWMNL